MPILDIPWLPAWVVTLLILVVSAAIAAAVHFIVTRTVHHMVAKRRGVEFWRPFLVRSRRASLLAFLMIGLSVGATVSPISQEGLDILRHLLLIAFIVLIGWGCLLAVDIASALYARRFRSRLVGPIQRKYLTEARLPRRVAATIVITLTLACALTTIDGVRQLGVSLLAAGGAAGLIVGLALQPVISNLFAGLQIAVTQPIRLGDTVQVQNEVGEIEEITSTYVVVKIWDLRRLVLPLTWFLQNPFQNWSRDTADQTGAVLMQLDYRTPISEVRSAFESFVKSSLLWDGKTASLQVTDFKTEVVEVRGLVSASDSGKAFDLRCEVREKMLGWLLAHHPEALPRTRLVLERTQPDRPRAGIDGGAWPAADSSGDVLG